MPHQFMSYARLQRSLSIFAASFVVFRDFIQLQSYTGLSCVPAIAGIVLRSTPLRANDHPEHDLLSLSDLTM
jgi:hypothetical protein